MDSRPSAQLLRMVQGMKGRAASYAASLAIVAASTGLAEVLFRVTGSTRLSMIFLAGVLVCAVLFGSGPAYLAAAAAFAVYNFYLVDPRFTFSLGSAEDFITLAVFLIVAMLTGNLAGRISDEAARAKARATTTAVLFGATREFSASSDENYIRQRLAFHLSVAAKGEAFVQDGATTVSEPAGLKPIRELLREAGNKMRDEGVSSSEIRQLGSWWLRPMLVGNVAMGVAAWRTLKPAALSSEEQVLVELLADAGAAAMSRAKLAAAKSEAETRARTEDLRNALLSSISHDMRTPLAAIMVSASSLRRYGRTFDEATRGDLASTIEEEAARLDAFVANLLSMTRLESGALVVQRIGFSVPEVVERVVGRRSTARPRVLISSAPDLPEGAGDPLLFEQTFGNVLENAMRYSCEDRPIAVSILRHEEQIVVEVADEGPGVSPEDLSRIFEKFFRSPESAHLPGTGLGLPIARGLVESMGGSIEARNREDAKSGLRVRMGLPVMR